jgi:hypothetical protein
MQAPALVTGLSIWVSKLVGLGFHPQPALPQQFPNKGATMLDVRASLAVPSDMQAHETRERPKKKQFIEMCSVVLEEVPLKNIARCAVVRDSNSTPIRCLFTKEFRTNSGQAGQVQGNEKLNTKPHFVRLRAKR